MTKRIRGWSNVRASRCRAAHYVSPDDNTTALCGAPIRTHVGKGKPQRICDHCNNAVHRARAHRPSRKP